jgi:hypothetical protein
MGVVIIVPSVVLTRSEEFGGSQTSVKRKITINYIDIDTTIGSVSSTHPVIRQKHGDNAASANSNLALAVILCWRSASPQHHIALLSSPLSRPPAFSATSRLPLVLSLPANIASSRHFFVSLPSFRSSCHFLSSFSIAFPNRD